MQEQRTHILQQGKRYQVFFPVDFVQTVSLDVLSVDGEGKKRWLIQLQRTSKTSFLVQIPKFPILPEMPFLWSFSKEWNVLQHIHGIEIVFFKMPVKNDYFAACIHIIQEGGISLASQSFQFCLPTQYTFPFELHDYIHPDRFIIDVQTIRNCRANTIGDCLLHRVQRSVVTLKSDEACSSTQCCKCMNCYSLIQRLLLRRSVPETAPFEPAVTHYKVQIRLDPQTASACSATALFRSVKKAWLKFAAFFPLEPTTMISTCWPSREGEEGLEVHSVLVHFFVLKEAGLTGSELVSCAEAISGNLSEVCHNKVQAISEWNFAVNL